MNSIWYKTSTGQIVETDIEFNTDYTYKTDASANAYDVQNIATHEFGHSLSLADLYGAYDSDKTMYGYGEKGETKKRTLSQDDINGIAHLYPVTISTAPTAPTLTVQTSGYTVTIFWEAVQGAAGYVLGYAPYPDASWYESADVGLQHYFSGEMPYGSAYYVWVVAYNTVGWSDPSNFESFIVDDPFPLQVTPSALHVKAGEAGYCTISGGTGYYGAYSDNPSVAQVSVSGSTLSVLAVAVGSATITVYDSASTMLTVSVTVTWGDMTPTYTNSLGQAFILLPAGTFTMGSPSDEPGRSSSETQHQVTLTQPFYMQTTEVTQAQWEAVIGSNPSLFDGCPTCPVESVSWNDVQGFITKMNARGEGTYSLPTEAQWEYAARAGSTTAFYNGGITVTECDYDPNLNAIGWYCYNDEARSSLVGQKAPNAWGLYDMSGNVEEWCSDWYGSYPSNAVTDPTGPSSGLYRVLRGGGWIDNATHCRSATRSLGSLDYRFFTFGFRLLRHP